MSQTTRCQTSCPSSQTCCIDNKYSQGLIRCGQPLDNSTALEEQVLGAVLVGHDLFTHIFLQDTLMTKSNLEKYRAMALSSHTGIPTVQNAKLLIRVCCAVRYQHLARVRPVQYTTTVCGEEPELIAKQWADTMTLIPTTETQRLQTQLPIKLGGIGAASLHRHCGGGIHYAVGLIRTDLA